MAGSIGGSLPLNVCAVLKRMICSAASFLYALTLSNEVRWPATAWADGVWPAYSGDVGCISLGSWLQAASMVNKTALTGREARLIFMISRKAWQVQHRGLARA